MAPILVLFFTVAPAEWKFPLHVEVFKDRDLHKVQCLLTWHLHSVFSVTLGRLFQGQWPKAGLTTVYDWVLRFEFQARGTLHVHALAWASLATSHEKMTGRSGTEHTSPLATWLEKAFNASVDVQASDGNQCLLRYVTSYVEKASDAITFAVPRGTGSSSGSTSQWRSVHRLLRLQDPTEQEIALNLLRLRPLLTSFQGDFMYAPVPGQKGQSRHTLAYKAYLTRTSDWADFSLLEWWRSHKVILVKGAVHVQKRGLHGPKAGARVAVGVTFPFELLDIFIGSFLATFVPHSRVEELRLPEPQHAAVPVVLHFLKAALLHERYKDNPDKLLKDILLDLTLRSVGEDRLKTFTHSFQARVALLHAVEAGSIEAKAWSQKRDWHPAMLLAFLHLDLCLFMPEGLFLQACQHACFHKLRSVEIGLLSKPTHSLGLVHVQVMIIHKHFSSLVGLELERQRLSERLLYG